MSDIILGGLLPRNWQGDKIAPWYVDVIVTNWLDVEVDQNIENKIPVLREIRGYRNREVYKWLAATRDYRDAAITKALYG